MYVLIDDNNDSLPFVSEESALVKFYSISHTKLFIDIIRFGFLNKNILNLIVILQMQQWFEKKKSLKFRYEDNNFNTKWKKTVCMVIFMDLL